MKHSTRYILRLIQAFFIRFKGVILIGTFLGVISFLLITLFIPSMTATTKKIGMVGRYNTNNLPEEVTRNISRGLTKIDSTGQVLPDLASSWETNDGGKTWIFNLNTDSLWQDNKKISSKDISYEFSDAKTERPDEKTITYILNSNFSAFPVIVSKPIFKKGLLGLGEYKVKKITLVGGIVQKIILQDKKHNNLVYRFYPTEDRLKLGFKLGEVDEVSGLVDPTPFDKWKTTIVAEQVSYDNFVAIFFNTEDEKLNEKSLRQALNYAVDKERYKENRALGPISPFSWAYNPQVKQYNKDVTKTKDVKDLNIKLSTLPNLLSVAEEVKKDWEAAGVKVEVEVTPTIPDNFQAFLATVDIPKDPDQYSLWHSTQMGSNISNYKSPRIDKLLEDGRTELDQEIRKKTYLDFQRFIVEDSPAIFLYHPTFFSVVKK